jgi:hypothetical protein
MVAARINIDRYRGDNYPLKLFLYKEEDVQLNIAGCTFVLKLTDPDGDSVTKIIDGTIVSAESGTVEFRFDSNTFQAVGKVKAEAEMTNTDGYKYTLANGVINIIQDLG